MKFKRVLTFSAISILSLGTLVGFTELNKVPVDRTFIIEDVKGDREALKSVSLESVMKVDNHSFEKVLVTQDRVRFEDTKFDLMYGVGEEVLNNKDLYRGMNHALKVKNNVFTLIASFNSYYPYASDEPTLKLAKKDHQTNQVTKETITLPGFISKQQVSNESLVEVNDTIYYAIVTQDISGNTSKPVFRLYEVDSDQLQVKEIMNQDISLPSDYTDVSEFAEFDGELYAVLSNQKECMLVTIDVATRKITKQNLPAFSQEGSYIEKFMIDQSYYYLTMDSVITLLDKETHKVKSITDQPSFLKDYEFVSTAEQKINENQLYVIYDAYKQNGPSDSYIVVYSQTSGNTLYEGKLPSMVNRGIGINYSFTE